MNITQGKDALNKFTTGISTTAKMIGVGALIFVLFIASLFVRGLVDERSQRQSQVHAEIAERWGKPQFVAGPIITIPYRGKLVQGTKGPYRRGAGNIQLLPKDLNLDANIVPEERSRGIFDSTVYGATIDFSGTFDTAGISELDIEPSAIDWHKAVLSVAVTDTRGLTTSSDLLWNDKPLSWKPGATIFLPTPTLSGSPDYDRFYPYPISGQSSYNSSNTNAPPSITTQTSGIQVPLVLNQKGKNSFSFSIDIQGSSHMSFLPAGDTTKVNVESTWSSPSFVGAYLPRESTLESESFNASWEVTSFGRAYSSQWMDNSIDNRTLSDSAFGVSLIQPVDFYTLVERTVKYAILFISLTFLAFFLFEIISKIRIHPMQYLLVGIALVLFYLLLLSFAENIGFTPAYVIAALMTIALVWSYAKSVLKTGARAQMLALMLVALYVYLYVVLQLEALALLFGSLLLFAVLAIVMRVTKNIDWYKNTIEENT